ncbi:MAG: aspartate-semialdehyde dehydrogenase [Verrucomicrobia bacterium]|nr:aspartate-semialdehyde dehydrogenase [Verrucomicrobiota bacterium]
MSKEAYNVCVVGAGAVGSEMVRLLKKHNFPMKSLVILARSERDEVIDGETYQVKEGTPEAFEGMDFAFFAGTEGSKGASQVLGWEAVARGCIVVDNGDDFRMDPRVPLVIPEVNAEALKDHQGFIANPNCSTIIALMALAPLHRAAGISRFVACTYQAVSGSGSAAIAELEQQAHAWAEGRAMEVSAYPHRIAFNVIPQIGGAKDVPGVPSEELKMKRETHKILGDDSIRISTTCVRVPVLNGHSEALHVELRKPLSVSEARDLFEKAEGVVLNDDLDHAGYPMPIDCSGKEDVIVGRIRKDEVFDNGLALFVAGDNLWKGAALNAIQIAEKMIEMGLA